MTTHDEQTGDAPLRGEAGSNISHFIPSVELKGSRSDKLETLDTLIAYLERLRRSLAGETLAARGGYEGPSRYIGSPAWPWFGAGACVGGVFVLLLFARSCA